MPKKVLFWPDVYKEQGHWLPTLKWAQDLYDEKDGTNPAYSICYMGIVDCKSIIDSYKINDENNAPSFNYHTIFENIYPSGYTTECHTSPNERWRPDHVWAIAYSALGDDLEKYKDKLNTDLFKDAQNFRKEMLSINPDLLVSGYFTSLESLLIKKIYNVKDVVISTTYLRHPSEDPAMRALQNLTAFSPTEYFKLVNLCRYQELKTAAGNEPVDLLQDPELDKEDFVKDLEDLYELIPCPKEYDYAHYTHGAKVNYVEPCILNKDLEGPSNSSLELSDGTKKTWSAFLQDTNKYQKLIFVTAGSQVLDYEGKARNLFLYMCEAMKSAELNEYHLVLGVGSKLYYDKKWDEYKKQPNITFASWVPQRAILSAPNLELALIHGGLATIKECVYNNKKFLILPLGKDQIDNALRLRKYGINNTVLIENISPKVLIDAIVKLNSDRKTLQNLEKLSEVFQQEELNREGTNLLKGILNKQQDSPSGSGSSTP